MADYPLPIRLNRHAVRAAAALLCSLCLCETAFCGTIPVEDQRCRTTYEIFVYSFCDSDADGIGDLGGVRMRSLFIRSVTLTQTESAIWAVCEINWTTSRIWASTRSGSCRYVLLRHTTNTM